MSSQRRRGIARALSHAVVILVLITGTALVVMYGMQRVQSDTQSGQDSVKAVAPLPAITPDRDRSPTLLVVGDSFAAGTGDPRFPTYPTLVANRMGWNLRLDAKGATGFLPGDETEPRDAMPFIQRLPYDAVSFHADYILVDGGRNDLGKLPDKATAAMDEYLKQLRAYFSQATIIVMLPSYATPAVADNYPVISPALISSAQSIGAYTIDPVAEGWYRDIDLGPLLGPDGVHLNAAGNLYYADRIVDSLSRLGIGGPPLQRESTPVPSAPAQGDRP
jgi:lysophospholipase L1-like esterase